MKLLQLIQSNLQSKRETRIEQSGREATVYLYDIIGEDWFGGVAAKDFVPTLNAMDVDTIHLRINSPGGDVFDGRAMANALRNHKARVVAHIDGQAASAATYVALAADEVEIAEGGFFMIHNAWTMAMGNADDFDKSSALLRKIDASIVADYQRKTGKDAEQIAQWMQDTTWFTAEDALANGFVDRISQGQKAARNHWNLAAYDNAPAALTAAAEPEPEIDRAALERRLSLLERIAP
ncbi:head maturation protease, ClpP-related [Pseudomonas paeninsulae]|uniref:head maturation protease, ClpP-related n=1 Tax=Pseudomonas paeninsulae TaxID=3110772 RepID=UPI002D7707AB|nr:head maturation protease, ClpP-related [Pseudomonas sp. IT1137]